MHKKIVKKIRDTLPATKVAFSSIVLRKDRQNINESGKISKPNFEMFTSKRILVLSLMEILMKVL